VHQLPQQAPARIAGHAGRTARPTGSEARLCCADKALKLEVKYCKFALADAMLFFQYSAAPLHF
jgi:hypothetical protein